MTESPSSLLERAAAALERLAEDAPQAPWRMAGDGDLLGYGPTPIVYSEYGDVEVQWAPGTFKWICCMSPSVASPLVEWLRDTAESLRMENEQVMDSGTDSALKFARIVLGEPE